MILYLAGVQKCLSEAPKAVHFVVDDDDVVVVVVVDDDDDVVVVVVKGSMVALHNIRNNFLYFPHFQTKRKMNRRNCGDIYSS